MHYLVQGKLQVKSVAVRTKKSDSVHPKQESYPKQGSFSITLNISKFIKNKCSTYKLCCQSLKLVSR